MSNQDIFTYEDLIKNLVHIGAKSSDRSTTMNQYIYSTKNNYDIIDIVQTAKLLSDALQFLYEVAAQNKPILFVGTKLSSRRPIKENALKASQYYVNYKWVSGTLTNFFNVVLKPGSHLKRLTDKVTKDSGKYLKKELLAMTRNLEKKERNIGGFKGINSLPEAIFVIDTKKDRLAIKEATKLGIKVVAICDTDADLEGIDYVIPGNDDSTKAIEFYLSCARNVITMGLKDYALKSNVDFSKEKAKKKGENKAENKEQGNAEKQTEKKKQA